MSFLLSLSLYLSIYLSCTNFHCFSREYSPLGEGLLRGRSRVLQVWIPLHHYIQITTYFLFWSVPVFSTGDHLYSDPSPQWQVFSGLSLSLSLSISQSLYLSLSLSLSYISRRPIFLLDMLYRACHSLFTVLYSSKGSSAPPLVTTTKK